MAIAGKLVAVLVLSSCLLLQQTHSYPQVNANSVAGYPSNQAAYSPYGGAAHPSAAVAAQPAAAVAAQPSAAVVAQPSAAVAAQPRVAAAPLPGPGAAVGDKETVGNSFYLMCTDCSRGRRRR
uniref:Uncharacterized protein n=1 Tax=Plectus sambesii TaxID=2011161 RepID=A0A914UV28_9BILA